MTTTTDAGVDDAVNEGSDTGIVDLLGAVIMFPAVLAHELTHALVAWHWIDASTPSDIVDRFVPPRLELRYPAGTPVVVVVVANLAPTLVGAALAPFLLPWVFSFEVPLLAYVFGSWALYTFPSADDLAVISDVF
ncbi:hypothetical protein [Halolamina salifodinae]|uniref:Zincin peptidase n=1 Tax=Halolamina salifodinae TaxID=1202767 RepID=A0A8T4H1Q4_9EURY|nr:hypothetical protein [Halolamina salifodinae]MBP1987248.1 hypothetical protein [Halolamina salifodinae]